MHCNNPVLQWCFPVNCFCTFHYFHVGLHDVVGSFGNSLTPINNPGWFPTWSGKIANKIYLNKNMPKTMHKLEYISIYFSNECRQDTPKGILWMKITRVADPDIWHKALHLNNKTCAPLLQQVHWNTL